MAQKIGFIGLGLIGGSIAKTIKRFYPDYELIAFDTNRTTLSLALQEETIDFAATTIDESYQNCDYIFLCAPVTYNVEYLKKLKPLISSSCIITDVGSVKTNVHEEVTALGMSSLFIGGHPMAGSEKTGYENATDHLLENAYYILTPSETVPKEKVESYQNFISTLNSIPLVLDYKEHDYVTAAVSHLPHIIASALVNFVKESDSKEELMKMIAAGGFKDITRIASSSPVMWQQICLENQSNIEKVMVGFSTLLQNAQEWVKEGQKDTLFEFFQSAGDYRNSIPNSSLGPIKKIPAIYCDIIDETGSISIIASILASNGISIKNIGIVHNREFEEAVLRIEFYDERASVTAATLLRKYRYVIYER